jgi:signal transduction histidine kinase
MVAKKKEVYKAKPMTEGKRNIIQGLFDEYDIETADDIQDALKDLLSGTIEGMMESEIDEHLGYGRYERAAESNSRNGTKPKRIRSKYGELEVNVPQDRQSTFEPKVVPKRQKDISSIDDKIISMYAKGMTTRQISETIEDIYGFEVSEGMVSDVTDKLLPQIEDWQNRPLSAVYPIVFIDAVHFSVRSEGVIQKLAAYVVLGINDDGRKEILSIIIGDNESSKFYYAIFLDITQQEKAIEAENAALEARTSSEAKSDFLSRMSHDIRTPLNAVLGFTSLALNEPDIPPNVAEYLNKIDSSGNYLIELINDVLDMAKIESGKMQINEENTDALALLNTLADTFTIQAAEKGVTLKTDFSKATTRWIMLDPLRTKQIFANLLSNAIKFSESGTQIDLIVTNEPKDADNIHTTITVKDQGCGMSQEFMDKMFMPFEQNAPSDAGTGTGLGLSIVHSLVEMMHGEIHVKSAPGKGSTFILEFDRELGKPPVNTQSDNNNSTVLKGIHILLCEDNDINALITEKLLEMIDCTIDRAENGQVGLEMFSKASSDMYDAIIMDINMPVMNGITAAKAIRALDHPNARSIPIIAMSANAFDDDIKKSLDAGMNAHISKPIDKQVLYDTLSKLIDSKN